MNRLPDAQSDRDNAALINRPSASGGDIRMSLAFRSAVAAVKDEHGENTEAQVGRKTRIRAGCMLTRHKTGDGLLRWHRPQSRSRVLLSLARHPPSSAHSRMHACTMQPCSASSSRVSMQATQPPKRVLVLYLPSYLHVLHIRL
jgi:hypothetical protein